MAYNRNTLNIMLLLFHLFSKHIYDQQEHTVDINQLHLLNQINVLVDPLAKKVLLMVVSTTQYVNSTRFLHYQKGKMDNCLNICCPVQGMGWCMGKGDLRGTQHHRLVWCLDTFPEDSNMQLPKRQPNISQKTSITFCRDQSHALAAMRH